MEKLTFINLLEEKIHQEIIRLKSASTLNQEKEWTKLEIYRELIKIVKNEQ